MALTGERLVRVRGGDGTVHVGVVREDEVAVLAGDDMLGTLERGSLRDAVESIPILDLETLELPEPWELLVPILAPETWAAGVTYERSRSARMHESKVVDVYELVYDAERPELFLKDAAGRRTVGPGVRARPRAARPGVLACALPDRMPDPRLRGCRAVLRGDFHREHATIDR